MFGGMYGGGMPLGMGAGMGMGMGMGMGGYSSAYGAAGTGAMQQAGQPAPSAIDATRQVIQALVNVSYLLGTVYSSAASMGMTISGLSEQFRALHELVSDRVVRVNKRTLLALLMAVFLSVILRRTLLKDMFQDDYGEAVAGADRPAADGADAGAMEADWTRAHKDVAIAQYDFSSNDSGELSFVKGEKLVVLDWSGGCWWKALKEDGREGLAPSNYLKMHSSI